MQLSSLKLIIAVLWLVAVLLVGVVAGVRSTSSWAVLIGVAVVPPLVLMLWWNDPRQTMSESIQEARR